MIRGPHVVCAGFCFCCEARICEEKSGLAREGENQEVAAAGGDDCQVLSVGADGEVAEG